jgi:hypothetical protein
VAGAGSVKLMVRRSDHPGAEAGRPASVAVDERRSRLSYLADQFVRGQPPPIHYVPNDAERREVGQALLFATIQLERRLVIVTPSPYERAWRYYLSQYL